MKTSTERPATQVFEIDARIDSDLQFSDGQPRDQSDKMNVVSRSIRQHEEVI